MTKRQKRLERLRQNPKNVKFEELRQVLVDHGFVLKRVRGSHHIFQLVLDGEVITFAVPFRRPIKAVYIHEALELIDEIAERSEIDDQEDNDNDDDD